MENATKALLIAAAVLVAILIISLGLVVYNMAAETVNNSANLSQQEIQTFNEQFTQYQGDNVRGSNVNALLKTALNNNITKSQEGKKAMKVKVTLEGTVVLAGEDGSETSLSKRADASKMYKVQVDQDGEGGLVHSITITKAGTTSSGGKNNSGGTTTNP